MKETYAWRIRTDYFSADCDSASTRFEWVVVSSSCVRSGDTSPDPAPEISGATHPHLLLGAAAFAGEHRIPEDRRAPLRASAINCSWR